MPLRGIAGSGFRTDSVESDFVCKVIGAAGAILSLRQSIFCSVRFRTFRMVRTFGRSDSISFCRDAGFRVQLRFCVGSAGKPAAGPSGFFAREGNIVFGGWPDCGVCVGSIRPRSRCSGFAITVRGVCGRGIAAVSDAVYSRAAIRSGCNRRFLSLYEY